MPEEVEADVHGLARETTDGFECRCGESFETETVYLAHLERVVGPHHPELPEEVDWQASWTRCEDQMPPEETWVLAWMPAGHGPIDVRYVNDQREWSPYGHVPKPITGGYWMPLPEAPTEDVPGQEEGHRTLEQRLVHLFRERGAEYVSVHAIPPLGEEGPWRYEVTVHWGDDGDG